MRLLITLMAFLLIGTAYANDQTTPQNNDRELQKLEKLDEVVKYKLTDLLDHNWKVILPEYDKVNERITGLNLRIEFHVHKKENKLHVKMLSDIQDIAPNESYVMDILLENGMMYFTMKFQGEVIKCGHVIEKDGKLWYVSYSGPNTPSGDVFLLQVLK